MKTLKEIEYAFKLAKRRESRRRRKQRRYIERHGSFAWALRYLVLALLLLPALAFAQTSPLPCPGSVTLTYSGGYTVTVNCSTDGTTTPPPPPPTGGAALPAGYVFIDVEYSRIVVPAPGSLAYGNGLKGFYFRAVNTGEIVYCQAGSFAGAPTISSPACYWKAN
jgi:hypothetical protein